MGERRDDNDARWVYHTENPGGDYKMNQIAVKHPYLVEATGTDGRFVGAIRPFPGMADSTQHGIPQPEAGQTVTSISNVIFAKYVSIQKGATRHTLKGIVYIADNQAANGGKGLYFAYKDSSGGDNVVELEDFTGWDDFNLDFLTEYDVTSSGKYIYFVCSGDTSSTPLPKWNEKEPPYNKAYFWDWKINDWDAFNRNGTGFESRFMGIMPTRLLESPLNADVVLDLLTGTQAATTASNVTIDLTADNPTTAELNDINTDDEITLNGITSGMSWSETLVIDTIDAANDTVDVDVAPQNTATNVTWTIKRQGTTGNSDLTFGFETESGESVFKMPQGNYTGGVELISRKHNLRSYIRYNNRYSSGGNGAIRFTISRIKLPNLVDGVSNQVNQLRGDSTVLTCLLYWGIPHVDGFRFWRTQSDGATVAPVGTNKYLGKYPLTGPLYLVETYKEKAWYNPTSGNPVRVKFKHFPTEAYPGTMNGNVGYISDTGLVTQQLFDALDESFGAMPRAKRITAYSGLVVGITDIAEPSTIASADWDQLDQRTEELFWSHASKLEPENFPPENRYPPDDPGEKFLALETAGDHCFGITTSSVYKLTRSGSTVAMNRILSRLGGVSRFAATGVGNVLFLVTEAGVKSIDGNTGAVKSISAMDRIIMDDGEWAASLANIQLEYDASMGVLVFLNTSKNECFLLWESSGAVTRLADCPWAFITAGGEPKDDGAQRVYFIDTSGVVHAMDGPRAMGKRSMCGTAAGETVNGTVTTGSTTQIVDTAAVFPANCVGHKVYMLSGARDGEALTVTVRDSDTTITVTGLSGTTTVGDRYSVSPVVTELVFQQLAGEGGVDPFSRKIATTMSVAFSDLGGETGSGDTNPYVRMGAWRNKQRLIEVEQAINILPDKCIARVNVADVRVYPSLRFLSGNIDFELQSLLIKGLLVGSEAQSRQA